MDGSWKDALGSVGGGKLVSDADLFNAFDGLKSTAKVRGVAAEQQIRGSTWGVTAELQSRGPGLGAGRAALQKSVAQVGNRAGSRATHW